MMKSDTEGYFKPEICHCPACGNKEIGPWLVKSNGSIQFNLWRCNACHTGFMNPQPQREYLDAIYHKSGHGLIEPISAEEVIRLETEYPNATVDGERLVGMAKSFLPGKQELKALDIGSGYGFFSRAAIQAGFEVMAVNPGKWENEIFESINGFSPLPYFFEEVDFKGKKFDLTILSQVLEHIEDPLAFLQKIQSLLSPGGIIAIAVPNVDSLLVKLLKARDNGCLWVPEHLTYFSARGLAALLFRAGFAVKGHRYVSRIPCNALSRRLNLSGAPRRMMNGLVKNIQKPPFRLMNWLGFGLIHNIWGQAAS
jgi:2-polyprenyl-3-methyl-5-hydroxy-6-metoxy-1,4-benzoquinol methylase